MILSFKERFQYNFSLWIFGLIKVRMINFCSPRIIEADDEKTILKMPLNVKTRNHVKSMYIAAMIVGVDLVTGFSAFLQIRKKKRNVIVIFKDLNANFLKRAEGDTYFTCKNLASIREAVDQTIESGERVNLKVPVIATVPTLFGKEPVAEFSITLSLKEK